MRSIVALAFAVAANVYAADAVLGPPPCAPGATCAPQYVTIGPDGVIVFDQSATIDFAGLAPNATPGPLRGYVLVYVNGEPMLMPVFAIPGRETPKLMRLNP